MAVLPTRTRRLLRQEVIKKFYRGHDIVVSTTTSGAQGTTTLADSVLSPTAETEDYQRTYVYVSTQPTAAATTSVMNDAGGISATDTSVIVTNPTQFTIGDGIHFNTTAAVGTGDIMRITNIVGTTFTVVRGIQGTTAAIRADGLAAWKIGPAVGEVSRCTNVSFAGTTSTLTLLPALSCALVSGQEYELHYDFHPSKVHELLDELHDVFLHQTHLPATIITDGDMRASGTTDWTASVATLTKDTTYSRHGSQALKIVATAANGQARSTAAPVRPSSTVLVDALVYVTSGDSAKLTLLGSATSGGTYVTIDSAASAASGWVRLSFVASLLSTQEYVKVYLESQAINNVTYWDHVIVWPVNKFDVPLPSTFEYGQDIEEVGYFPLGQGLSATGDDNAYEDSGKELTFYCHFSLGRDDLGLDPIRVNLVGVTKVDQPLWVRGWKDFDAFTSDSDTSKMNKEILVQHVLAELLDAAALKAEDAEKHDLATRLTEWANSAREQVAGLSDLFGPVPRGVIQGAFKRER